MTVRDELLKSLIYNSALANNTTFIQTIKEQGSFDQFKYYFHEDWRLCKLEKSNELLEVISCNLGEKKIIFNLFNSSWMSTKKEKPGHMHFPTNYVENIFSHDFGDINISLIHHPDHWLHPNNKREMEALLQSKSDFILSGHEHVPTSVTMKQPFLNYHYKPLNNHQRIFPYHLPVYLVLTLLMVWLLHF
jgi:hypothetical protein